MKVRLLLLLLVILASPVLASDLQVDSLTAGTTDSALISADSATSPTLRVWCGFSARETGGAATATVDVYNGTSTSGELIFTFSLSANESRSEGPWDDDQCIPSPNGVFIDRGGSGTPKIAIYTRESFSR